MQESLDNQMDGAVTLRRINWAIFVNFWVAFPFLLSHGLLSGFVCPAIGILPLALSATAACYNLIKMYRKNGQYQILLGDEDSVSQKQHFGLVVSLIFDLGVFGGDIITFVFTCLTTYTAWWNRGFEALAAYGTVMLFVDAGLHAVLFYKGLRKLCKRRQKHDCTLHCANCRAARAAAESSSGSYSDIVEVAPVPREGGAGGPA